MPVLLTESEKKIGRIYFFINLLLLPTLVSFAGLALNLDTAGLNFLYYCINFILVVLIFRKFLWGNLLVALDRVLPVIWYAVLGYLGFQTLGELFLTLIHLISPDFVNMNDASVALMVRGQPLLCAAIILLVPIAEETLYRGLIFRDLFDTNPLLAYSVSMTLFSAIHVAGYIGMLTPLQLLLSFVQYLPAGYCLAFVYRRSGTILCPIFVHMAVNAMGVFSAMR